MLAKHCKYHSAKPFSVAYNGGDGIFFRSLLTPHSAQLILGGFLLQNKFLLPIPISLTAISSKIGYCIGLQILVIAPAPFNYHCAWTAVEPPNQTQSKSPTFKALTAEVLLATGLYVTLTLNGYAK